MSYRDKNGTATYRVWDGGTSIKIVENMPARITPKRIAVYGFAWDGDGLQTSPTPRTARVVTRLVSYQINGQDRIEVNK